MILVKKNLEPIFPQAYKRRSTHSQNSLPHFLPNDPKHGLGNVRGEPLTILPTPTSSKVIKPN